MLNYEVLSLFLIVLFSILFCILVAWKKPKSKNNRTKNLWILIILNGLFFYFGLLALFFFLPQSPLSIISWVVYDFLITFSLCIEIPAYLTISKFDESLANSLKELRKELIEMPFSFDEHFQGLKAKRSKSSVYLKGENLDKLLEDFISFSEKIDNYNEKVWSLTLNETSAFIDDVTKRSKHPFPKLIDILALSGLSLLLAQFLKLL